MFDFLLSVMISSVSIILPACMWLFQCRFRYTKSFIIEAHTILERYTQAYKPMNTYLKAIWRNLGLHMIYSFIHSIIFMRTLFWSSTVLDARSSTLKMFMLKLERPTFQLLCKCYNRINYTQITEMLFWLGSGGCFGSFLGCDNTWKKFWRLNKSCW